MYQSLTQYQTQDKPKGHYGEHEQNYHCQSTNPKANPFSETGFVGHIVLGVPMLPSREKVEH
jgi:hypothetical protein